MDGLLFDLIATQGLGTIMVHGGGEYAEIIFNELLNKSCKLSCVYDSNRQISTHLLEQCKRSNIELFDVRKQTLQDIIRTNNFNVFYSALPYTHGSIDFGSTVFIGTIHGLRTLEIFTDKYEAIYVLSLINKLKVLLKQNRLAAYFFYRIQKQLFNKLFSNKSFKFITVSNHTKYSILSFFPQMIESDIKVFYSPLVIKDSSEDLKSNLYDGKYYLMLSGDRWLKNTYRALLAFDNLLTNKKLNCRIIVTGIKAKYKALNRLKNPKHFLFFKYVDNDELYYLFKNAYCFVYPSLNEGFGLPPLMSMNMSTPVIASSLCSIPEICDNAALYFNPYSVAEIKNRILQIENDVIRNDLIKRGHERFKFIRKKQKDDLEKAIEYILSYCD